MSPNTTPGDPDTDRDKHRDAGREESDEAGRHTGADADSEVDPDARRDQGDVGDVHDHPHADEDAGGSVPEARARGRRRLDPSTFTIFGITFELLLIPVALLVAWLLPGGPPDRAQWSGADFGRGILLTLPLVAALMVVTWTPLRRLGPLRRIFLIFRRHFGRTFAGLRLWQIIAVSAAAGVGEEFLFRGALQSRIGIAATSILFGALHWITPTYFVFATAMGVYLGWAFEWSGNLLVAIVVHAVYDAVALTVLRAELRRRGLPRERALDAVD